MMLPLVTGDHASPLIWRDAHHDHDGDDQVVTRAGFIHAAMQLATRLPCKTHVINLCASRLGFMLAWTAAALRGQTTLLPPNQTPAALQLLQDNHPQHHVIDDACLTDLDWNTGSDGTIEIDSGCIIATLFTSGSTGVPQPHAKTWGSLTRTAQLDAQCFTPKPINLVATVPSQHMFGLQTTVLLPLLAGCTIHDSKPFFPADIRAALNAIPAPRALITTPAHLRTCIASELQVPEIQFVLSATAPLSVELAQQTEALWNTTVLEIYGSTEAGAIGTRRTTHGDAWQLQQGTQLRIDELGTFLHAPHLPALLQLNDQIELLDERHFRLLGRDTDQVKIAGKRGSLSELTRVLLSIDGVTDGVVFMPPHAERTAALVTASGIDTAHILDALAQQVDAVFLPRPLIMMEKLPRNEVGKLTQGALLDVLHHHLAHSS